MKKVAIFVFSALVVSGWMMAPLSAQVSEQIEQSLPQEVREQGFADLILLNGKIVSMDDVGNNDNPGTIYEAMAVKRDRIMALGSNQQIRRLASSSTRTIDLKGRTVIPGIVETHAHIYGVDRWADDLDIPLPYRVAIPEGDTVEQTRVNIRDALLKAAQEVKPGEWIVAGMTANPKTGARNSSFWASERKLANREFLDGVTRRQPVLLRAGVRGFINTTALELANEFMGGYSDFINQSMGEESELLGWLGTQEMAALTWEIFLGDQPIEKLAEGTRRNLEMAAAHGLTTFSTRIPMPTIMSIFAYLDRTGQMPIRLGAHFETHRRAAPPEFTRAFYKQTGALWGMGSDYLWFTGVASERWDSVGPEACLGDDISARPEIKWRERCPEPGSLWWDVLKNTTLSGWRPAGVHGVGSHGVRLFTQMLDEVVKEKGWTAEHIRELRPTVEHATVLGVEPDVMRKLKEYGIIVSLGGSRINQGHRLIEDYGPELEKFVVPTKSLLDSGIRVVGQGGATGLGYQIWRLVTRKVGGTVVGPDEAIDRVRALKMWTRWAGEYVLREKDLGSLETGKLADFVVLDRDYFTIAVDDIRAIVPLMTVVGGEAKFLHRSLAQEVGLQPLGYRSEILRPWDERPRGGGF